ncbi:hypothetical protein Pcinc_034092 [Petrolisthes cinctipes]|uniref:Uncharacterized protein n=1 Tax=Petrolisthes cinctipes TaxID=88211 RepID=A0AAE1EQZ9_PETCI|nr:hypothetical protein Pcinc_034092 [Petrolisthes cinctipes]
MASYDEVQSRMWHLDHDPYNRTPSEPRHYNSNNNNPARHSYTPHQASTTTPLDQYRAQSMDAVDSDHWRPGPNTRNGFNDPNGFNGPNGRVPGTRVVEVGGGRVPSGARPPRAGKRPRGPRNSGHKGGGGVGGIGGGTGSQYITERLCVCVAPSAAPRCSGAPRRR